MSDKKCPRCGSFTCRLRSYDTQSGRSQLYRDCVAQREGLTPTPSVEA